MCEKDFNKGLLAIKKYKIARFIILAMCIMSILNSILLFINSELYFSLSLSIPIYGINLFLFQNQLTYGIILMIIGYIMIVLIIIMFFLSKTHLIAIIISCVLFSIDTIILLININIDIEWFISFFFHCWIAYYYVVALINGRFLNELSCGMDIDEKEYLNYISDINNYE